MKNYRLETVGTGEIIQEFEDMLDAMPIIRQHTKCQLVRIEDGVVLAFSREIGHKAKSFLLRQLEN